MSSVAQKSVAKKNIVMIGTRFETMGGISSVVNVYRDAGFFDRHSIVYLSSHGDGGKVLKFRLLLIAFFRLLFFLMRMNVAVVHLHMSSRASFWRKSVYFVLSKFFRVPVIVHLHGGEFAVFYEKESGLLARRFIRWVYDHSDAVIVLSDTWKKWVASISENKNIFAIYNPIVLPKEIPNPSDRKKGSVLFLGRLGKLKGTYDLVHALSQINSDWSATLSGDGDIDQIARLSAELGVSDRVSLTGWIRGNQKVELLRQAQVYVLPSYNEGLPMSLLEAMGYGLPVITTPVGGIPEAVTEGVNGYLVKPGDVGAIREKLAYLITNPEVAGAMGKEARTKVESCFSVEKILPQLEAVYRHLGVLA